MISSVLAARWHVEEGCLEISDIFVQLSCCMLSLNLYGKKDVFQKAGLFICLMFQNSRETNLAAWTTSFDILTAFEVVCHYLLFIVSCFPWLCYLDQLSITSTLAPPDPGCILLHLVFFFSVCINSVIYTLFYNKNSNASVLINWRPYRNSTARISKTHSVF